MHKDIWGRPIEEPIYYVELRYISSWELAPDNQHYRAVNKRKNCVRVGTEAECEKRVILWMAEEARNEV